MFYTLDESKKHSNENKRKENEIEASMSELIPFAHDDHEITHEMNKKLRFEPPLYIQRYDYVADLISKHNCKTYLDIGCSESKLLRYLKNTNQILNLIVGLDVDETVILESKEKFSCSWFDCVQLRENPLEIFLIKGDISNPSAYFINQMNQENLNLDFVSLVEIIEHMYPETLSGCIETVFSKLKPKLVLITTPNAEFNVVFDSLCKNENDESPLKSNSKKKFRHWDHKFEWTRKEFQNWCQKEIIQKFKYYDLVEYDGLGVAPPNPAFSNVGYCSQIALFKKKESYYDIPMELNQYQIYLNQLKKTNFFNRRIRKGYDEMVVEPPYFDSEKFIQENCENPEKNYKVGCHVRYPFECFEFDNIDSRNQALLSEINYLIYFLCKPLCNNRNSEGDSYENINQLSYLTDEQKEKIENNIDLCDETISIASLEKLFGFQSIQKFKLDEGKLIEIMKMNGFEFTKSNKYVIYKKKTEDDPRYYDDYCSNSNEEELNQFSNEADEFNFEQSNNENSILYQEEDWDSEITPIKCNPAKVEEEDWDLEIAQNLSNSVQIKHYSIQEQFQDCDGDCDLSKEKSDESDLLGKEIDESRISNESMSENTTIENGYDSLTNAFEINYNTLNAISLSLKFKSLKKKNSREQRKKKYDCPIVLSQFEND